MLELRAPMRAPGLPVPGVRVWVLKGESHPNIGESNSIWSSLSFNWVAKDTHKGTDAKRVQLGSEQISYEWRVCETNAKCPWPCKYAKLPISYKHSWSRIIGGHLIGCLRWRLDRYMYCCRSRQIGVRNHTDAQSHSHI